VVGLLREKINGERERAEAASDQDGYAAVRPNKQRHAVEVCAEIAGSVGIEVTALEPKLLTSEKSDRTVGGLLGEVGAPQSNFVIASPFGTCH